MAVAFKTLTGAAALWSVITIAATHRDGREDQTIGAPPPPVVAPTPEAENDFNDRWPLTVSPSVPPLLQTVPPSPPARRLLKPKRERFHCHRRYYYKGHHKFWRCQR
jgi:hypothetical protein